MTISTPVAPTEQDRKVIETFARALEDVPVDHAQIVVEGKKTDSLAVPRPVFEILKIVADQMGKGKAISVVPIAGFGWRISSRTGVAASRREMKPCVA